MVGSCNLLQAMPPKKKTLTSRYEDVKVSLSFHEAGRTRPTGQYVDSAQTSYSPLRANIMQMIDLDKAESHDSHVQGEHQGDPGLDPLTVLTLDPVFSFEVGQHI